MVHGTRPGLPFTDVDSATSYEAMQDGQLMSNIFIGGTWIDLPAESLK